MPVASADVNTAVTGGAATNGNVLKNDTDADGDKLSITGFADGTSGTVGSLFHATYGDLKLNADGSYSYTAGATLAEQAALAAATPGSHPKEVVTYTESDGHGGIATNTLTITLDRLPVASTHVVEVLAGVTSRGATGDIDLDGDTVGVNAVTGGSVGHAFAGKYGTLVLTSDKTYAYTANNSAAIKAAGTGDLTDTFTYTAGDGHGGTIKEAIAFHINSAGAETNVTLPHTNATYVGNANDNLVAAGIGTNFLTGGGGNDTFIFRPGFTRDTITDFNAGDHIQFDHSQFATFASIMSHTANDGNGNSIIAYDANHTITLDHVLKESLIMSDFHIR